MKQETLKKAKELERKIQEYERALNCFEYEIEPGRRVSLNPQLVIEYDWDGREQQKIPEVLSNAMVEFMVTYIKEGLEKAKAELEAL